MRIKPIGVIINDIKHYHTIYSDYAVAKKLGVPPSHISMWRKRGTVPFRVLIEYCVIENIDIKQVLCSQKD